MSLKEQLMQDLKQAMKDKDTIKKDTIQIVRAGVLQIEKDEKIDSLDDERVMQVIQKEIKKRIDVLPDYEKANRIDQIEEIKAQIKFLESYLPEQLSDDELKSILIEELAKIGASSAKDMGKAMQHLKDVETLKGHADNKRISEHLRQILK